MHLVARVLALLERIQSCSDAVLAAHRKKPRLDERIEVGTTSWQISEPKSGKAIRLLWQLPQRQAAHLLPTHFNANNVEPVDLGFQLLDQIGFQRISVETGATSLRDPQDRRVDALLLLVIGSSLVVTSDAVKVVALDEAAFTNALYVVRTPKPIAVRSFHYICETCSFFCALSGLLMELLLRTSHQSA